MQKFIKILIFTFIILAVASSFAVCASAQTSMAEFQMKPLFSETNFVPGDAVTRWIKLHNNAADEVEHQAFVKVYDVENSDGLGDVLHLVISDGTNVWFDDTLTEFFSRSYLLLEKIPTGQERTYNFIVTFEPSSGNEYQEDSLGFSLGAGFEGLGSETDNGVNGGTGGDGGQTGGGGSQTEGSGIGGIGGDGGSGSFPGGSRRFYTTTGGGTSSGSAGEVLGDNAVSFSDENDNQQNDGQSGSIRQNIFEELPIGEIAEAFDNNLAAVYDGVYKSSLPWCYIWGLIILLVTYFIWRFLLKKRYEDRGFLKDEIKGKFFAIFDLVSGLAVIILFLVKYYCPIPLFLVVFVISAIMSLYYKYLK